MKEKYKTISLVMPAQEAKPQPPTPLPVAKFTYESNPLSLVSLGVFDNKLALTTGRHCEPKLRENSRAKFSRVGETELAMELRSDIKVTICST